MKRKLNFKSLGGIKMNNNLDTMEKNLRSIAKRYEMLSIQ